MKDFLKMQKSNDIINEGQKLVNDIRANEYNNQVQNLIDQQKQ